MAIMVSDDDDIKDDPHQVVLISGGYNMPYILLLKEENPHQGYFAPVTVKEFAGIYYRESRDLKPGYAFTTPRDYPLDRRGHIATKLHSEEVAYTLYLRLVTSGIPYTDTVDGQQTDYHYSNVVGVTPPAEHHTTWGSLHFLPLISNVFLPRYESET